MAGGSQIANSSSTSTPININDLVKAALSAANPPLLPNIPLPSVPAPVTTKKATGKRARANTIRNGSEEGFNTKPKDLIQSRRL